MRIDCHQREADWRKRRPAEFRPYLEIAGDAFGPERVTGGSDWPVRLVAGSSGQEEHAVQDLLRWRPAEERETVFGSKARDFTA